MFYNFNFYNYNFCIKKRKCSQLFQDNLLLLYFFWEVGGLPGCSPSVRQCNQFMILLCVCCFVVLCLDIISNFGVSIFEKMSRCPVYLSFCLNTSSISKQLFNIYCLIFMCSETLFNRYSYIYSFFWKEKDLHIMRMQSLQYHLSFCSVIPKLFILL